MLEILLRHMQNELMKKVSHSGFSFTSKFDITEKEFDFKLSLPGHSKAKFSFKKDNISVQVEGQEKALVWQLPEDFYSVFDIKTISHNLEHGVLHINVKAFENKINCEDNDVVFSIELGYDELEEINFNKLSETFSNLKSEKYKQALGSLIEKYSNGHSVKKLCSSKVIELSNEIALIKEESLNENDDETAGACDLTIHLLEYIASTSFEEESTHDFVESSTPKTE